MSKLVASRRSRFSLDVANFFLAQLTGLGSPYLSAFLFDRGWREGAIGVAQSMPALGVLLFQTHAGWLLDRWRRPRLELAFSSIVVGLCYVLLTFVAPGAHATTFAILFASGVAQSFFAPLLCGIALGLVGHADFTRTLAWNEAYNHLGEMCSAILALFVVTQGVSSVFYLIGVIALLAGGAALLIRDDEIDRDLQSGGTERRVPLEKVLRDRRIVVLIISTTMFQFAMTAAVPFAALRVRTLGGTNQDIAVYVLVGAAGMVPVAALSGRAIDHFGWRFVFAIAFLLQPLALFVCALARSPTPLILVQGLRGVAQGIFGVAIVAASHEVARGTGRFQALTGASRAALAAGALAGPLPTGFLLQRAGFEVAFIALTLVASAAAATFLMLMPAAPVRAEDS